MKMTPWHKRYHPLYEKLKSGYDPRVVEWISEKEERIVAAPFSFPSLRHRLSKVRRFKSGKLRILYVLSTEREQFWESPPHAQEILFLYVDLRSEETYTEALKLLRKHRVLRFQRILVPKRMPKSANIIFKKAIDCHCPNCRC